MSNHSGWHDQQGQYPGAGSNSHRHQPNMNTGMNSYNSQQPSQQGGPFAPQHHGGYSPSGHLSPSVGRQPHPQWQNQGPPDFGGPSPSSRSSGAYGSYESNSPMNGSTGGPQRSSGGSGGSYGSQQGSYPPHLHGPPDQHTPLSGPRGGPHGQYEYFGSGGGGGNSGGGGYPPMSQQQQPPQPQQQQQHSQHPYAQQQQQQQQPQQQHAQGGGWNTGPLPSVLQPQSAHMPGPASSLASAPRSASRTPNGAGPGTGRSYGFPPTGVGAGPSGSGIKLDDGGDEDDDGAPAQGVNKGGTSDFVKKLFSMLDDKAYDSIVAWSPSGESFIVKDMNDFTKHVLPRNFRHSNFASFVRQLNKYDFHKVKNPEDGSGNVGEHVWEFEHPAFKRGREDLLENVRRKIPAKKKPTGKGGVAGIVGGGLEGDRDDSPTLPHSAEAAEKAAESYSELKAQVASLTAMQDQMQNHILGLTKQYQGVIGEMLTFQRNMVQQDQLMQNLIQYLMNLEQDRRIEAGPAGASTSASVTGQLLGPGVAGDGPFLPPDEAAKLIGSYEDVAQASFTQMSEIARRASIANASRAGPRPTGASSSHATSDATATSRLASGTSAPSSDAPLSPKSVSSPMGHGNDGANEGSTDNAGMILHPPHSTGDDADLHNRNDRLIHAAASSVRNPSLNMPKLDARNGSTDSTPAPPDSNARSGNGGKDGKDTGAGGDRSTPSDAAGAGYLRVRRSTLVPGWAVPPRVLLVDDDEVCRRLSSKFLQVFGCSIDYAVDGMSAVNKMNLEKYDLVLMDIVMPNLDGVSATSLIRQFDPRTPIISMTSNSGPSELINYMSSGMNDILPKPFTKEGLLNMLEKHLIHLKTVQKMEQIPKSRGLGSFSEGSLQQALEMTMKGASPMPQSGAGGIGGNLGGGGGGGASSSSTPSGLAGGPFGSNATGADADGTLNPLAGMGFSDEEYVAMLQNLIAAGTVSDPTTGHLANPAPGLLNVQPGEGLSNANANANGRKEPSSHPHPHAHSHSHSMGLETRTQTGAAKRSAPDEPRSTGPPHPPTSGANLPPRSSANSAQPHDPKRSRFTEIA
ncbi:hypothetical protein BCV70DRAFT_161330 [Testicularia cyperi]|uniref:Response regulatory domain-containing protein n=1 Tax=Testicularia cyperi TaxID=1882483 RepID=A0A317XQB8_9BASI|nr:hypothetical protein BCV70DRAFT_161330 [Testicularia cyperi]